MINTQEYFLENGLKVILKDVPNSTVSSVFIWVKTGSAYENDYERGLAHVHEHMIFKGTSKLGVGEISKKIESYGGDVNAFTSFDETAYFATVSNDFVPQILDIFSQCMYDATFDSEELSKELEVILEEIKRGNDSPSNRLWDMVFESVFSGNDYSLPIIGTPKSVSSYKQDDIKNFYNKWYVAKNMSVIIVGSINKKNIKKNIEKYFSPLRNYEVPQISKNFKTSDDQKILCNFQEMDVNETYFNISFSTPDANDLKYASFDLFSAILGSGESSILYKKIKEELGLVTTISSGNYTLRHGGLFYIQGTTANGDIYDVIYKIIDSFVELVNGNFDKDQLQRVKTEILLNDIYSQETVQSQARTIGNLFSNNQDLSFIDEYKNVIISLNKKDLLDNIKKNFNVKKLKFNFLSPINTNLTKPKNFEKIIKDKIKFNKKIDNDIKDFKSINYSLKKIISPDIKVYNLDSNIKLLCMQNNKTPLISLRAASLGGSNYENKETNGSFGLLSEMFLRGSEKFAKNDIAIKTEILGSEFSGFSGRNSFGLKMIGPSAHINKLIPIFSDVVLNPTFLDSEFQIAKSDTLSYISKLSKNSSAVVSDIFFKNLFKDHCYGLNQIGTKNSITNISSCEIKKIHNNFINKNNLILCATGNFDVSELKDNLDEHFKIESNNFKIPKIKPFQRIEKNVIENIKLGDKQQSHIIVGTYAPDIKSDERYIFNIINSVLSGMGGRLFIELRDKKSLAYSVTSFFTPALDYGYFGIYIGCSPTKKMESINSINNELKKLLNNGISEDELERAKNSLIGKNDISLQRNANINSRISIPYLYGLDPNEPFTFSEKIRSINKAEVDSAIQKFLNKTNFVTVSVDPN